MLLNILYLDQNSGEDDERVPLREDTHKKGFFSGRTNKAVGRVNPPHH